MDFKKRRLSDKAKQAELRRTGGTPEAAPFHRPAYHRNFEGYTEVKRIDEHGRTVIQRIYTGKYYEPDLAPFRRITLRLFYILFFVGGTGLFLYCATRELICNTILYVNLFQAVAIPLLLWCIYVLIFYIPSTGKLTVGEYNTQHKPLINASRLASLCMWATAGMVVAAVVLHLDREPLRNLLCAAGYICSGAMMFLISWFESNLNYIVTSSSEEMPPDGVEIE